MILLLTRSIQLVYEVFSFCIYCCVPEVYHINKNQNVENDTFPSPFGNIPPKLLYNHRVQLSVIKLSIEEFELLTIEHFNNAVESFLYIFEFDLFAMQLCQLQLSSSTFISL
jgi:hypothetical protein